MDSNEFFPRGFTAGEALLNKWKVGIQGAISDDGVLYA
jgi:hypothetical protein